MDRQDKVWAHFQNRDPGIFEGARPRLDFLIRQIFQKKTHNCPRILNIGAGAGYLEITCKKQGWEVYCLDPDQNTISRLRQQGIEGRRGYIEDMPFDNSFFDFVIASEVLEHLEKGQRIEALAEVLRTMRLRGWFLGTVPYNEDLRSSQVICPRCGEVFHRWGHKDSFDYVKLYSELSGVFDYVKLKKCAFADLKGKPLLGKIKAFVRIILGRFGSQLAMPNIYFEARKEKKY